MKTYKIETRTGTKEWQGHRVNGTNNALAIVHAPESDAWTITHVPSGRRLPGIYKSSRRAANLAKGWWQRLTDKNKQTFIGVYKKNLPVSNMESQDAFRWFRKQYRRYALPE